MPTYFQRPENALKRANEFIDVGKKQRALDALYDVIKSKKHRTWQKIHEPIMNKYLELCVELKKSHIAKEGLFQYRNICQQVNIKSLEDVVRGYLQLAEEKTEAAREESQQAVDNLVDDLDNLHSPESLLLSAVSGEDAQDRTDRVLLTPWVKFLWESYRQCLELLRNNVRVERLYHDIAQQAFRFCLKYNRKTEFRKLCDNLRTHLENILKHQNQQNNINLNNPESQAMHLETRLCQLDSAIQMELWQEAYKAVEDIHRLMTLSKKPPKPQLMANYYQKLSLVLWKAGNYLFHASALFRLFHLSRDLKKNLTPEEVQRMASRVLLATLTIPIPPSRNEIDKYLETDENTMEKQRRLATLLGLSNPPNRSQLIKDLVRFNVIQFVMPQLQDLYRWLEVEFHPLKLCIRVQQCFEFIQKNKDIADFQQYIPALQEVTLMRLLKQVSQVYQTIQFSRLLELAPFANAFYLERVVVDAAKNNDLQVRIDHRTRSLHFGMNLCVAQREDVPEGPHLQSMPSEQIRNQLINMSSVLHRTVNLIQPAKFKQEKEELRQSLVTAYRNTAKKKHLHILARRQIIEERKEMLENLNIQREEEERRQLEEQRKKQMLLEEERLQREADERERQRRVEEHKEIKRKHVKDKIEQLKKTGYVKFFQEMDEEELEKLDADEIMARQVEQLDRERKELQAKLKAQEKKVDYLERAKRLEEIPLLQKALEDKSIQDREFWEQQEKERIKQMIEERKVAMQHRDRLRRLHKDKEEFLEQLRSARMSVYKAKLTEFEKKLDEERNKRLVERKEERKLERRIKWQTEKEEESIRKKEEEHRRIVEEQERERQAKLAAEQAAYQAKKDELERITAKQRAREKEIEEKERQRQEEERSRSDKDRPGSRRLGADDWRRKTAAEDRPETEEKVGPWRPIISSTSWRQREKERQDSWCPRRDDFETSRGGDLESSKLEDREREKRDESEERPRPDDRNTDRESIWRSSGDHTDGVSRDEDERPREEGIWRRGADRDKGRSQREDRAPPPKEDDLYSRDDRDRDWRRDDKRSFGREEGSRQWEDTPRSSDRGGWGRRDDRGGGGSGWRSNRDEPRDWRDDDKERGGPWRSSGTRDRDRDFRRDDRDDDRRGFRDSDRRGFRDSDRRGDRDFDRRDLDRRGDRGGDRRGGDRDMERRVDRTEDRDFSSSWRMKEDRAPVQEDRDWRMESRDERVKPALREEKKELTPKVGGWTDNNQPNEEVLSRKPDLRRKEEPDEDGWTTVRR